jgi:hypothetical protein
VQWQVSSNNGASYTNVAGATSSAYTFTPTLAQSGSIYRAVFTNAAGTATTTAATLKVNPVLPVVTTSPSSQTVNVGTLLSLTAAATGTPTPTVQWQVSTNNGATYANIPGATSTAYTLTAAASQSGSLYRAVFTNAAGTATTAAATLKVVVSAAPPVVTANPSGQTVYAGASVSFTAAATGTPAPSTQWQVSTNNGASYTNVPGATAANYAFTAAFAQSGNLYRAVFTNTAGATATAAATLTVKPVLPVVTTNPSSQTGYAGTSVTFTAAATGTPTPTVQWQVSTNNGASYTSIPAATATTYTLTAAAAQSGNLYRAIFSNSAGTATTTAATLVVSGPLVVTTNPSSQTVFAGASVAFTAAATATPTPTVQWQVSTNNGASYTNIPGATATTYAFTAATAQSGNMYRAVFTNSASGTVASTAATLKVNPVVTVVLPTRPVIASPLRPLTITPTTTPTPAPSPVQPPTMPSIPVIRLSGSTTTSSPISAGLAVLSPAAVDTVLAQQL